MLVGAVGAKTGVVSDGSQLFGVAEPEIRQILRHKHVCKPLIA